MKWLFAALFFLFVTPVRADEMRPAYIEFSQIDATHWQLFWKLPIRSGISPQSQPILPDSCDVQGEPVREAVNLTLTTKSQIVCTQSVFGKYIGLSDFGTNQSDVFVRIAPLNSNVQSLRLNAEQPNGHIKEKPNRWQVAQTYFITGVEHILRGYDHLLFVLALVLLLRSPWTIAKAATAFTVAHSITLAGATLGLIGLPQRPVEILIALSIVFMAVEIAKKNPQMPRLSERIPWVIAFIFGLIHGFGFAGALREIGLPEGEVPTSLLTFNLGVEAGQLIIILFAVTIIEIISRLSKPMLAPIVRIATYSIGIIASFWFIERLFS
ncbi:MAG: hypothetical protein FD163_2340 [Hyphomonadaceae bacterium]|nr:MAG: hypothetical protein FD128_1051 [Hyphomonadaceae bacterium]KAF0183620.1 MAG: hypothetical protein FD163_2340 [Hyphomonadaceae bacterium]